MQHPHNVQEDSDAQAKALEMQRRIGRMIGKQGRAATLADLMTPTATKYLRCHYRRAPGPQLRVRQRRPGCERPRARRTARRSSSRAGPDDDGGEPAGHRAGRSS